MLRELVPDVPLVVGRRRVLAAELVHDSFPGAVLLMDDGFQHLPLAKDISILIEDPFSKNQHCLPAGPYREPRSNLKRADAVIWRGGLAGFRLLRGDIELSRVPSRVTVICALAQPESFLAGLRAITTVEAPLVLGDHDPLTSGTLFDQVPAGLPIVVTMKDWVKLRHRSDLSEREILVATQEVCVEPEAEFRNWLLAKLDESKKK
jgi:tetraacyldisaccharide 4'-kinase